MRYLQPSSRGHYRPQHHYRATNINRPHPAWNSAIDQGSGSGGALCSGTLDLVFVGGT